MSTEQSLTSIKYWWQVPGPPAGTEGHGKQPYISAFVALQHVQVQVEGWPILQPER